MDSKIKHFRTTPAAAGKSLLGSLAVAVAVNLMLTSSGSATTNTWTGATDVNWSNAGNWDIGVPTATDDAVFSTNALAGDISTVNNTVDTNLTVDSLSYIFATPNTALQYHNTSIADGVTLTISNSASFDALFTGSGQSLTNMITYATMVGANGSLVVNAPSGNVNVRQGGLFNFAGTATLDLSGLSNAVITTKSLLVAGDGNNGGDFSHDRASGHLYLAQNTTITNTSASSANPPGITMGYINGNGGPGSSLILGNTNRIYSDSGMGIGLNRSASTLNFLNSGSYAYFRNTAGTGRQSKWEIGDSSLLAYSGNPATGTVDFSGSTVDAQVDQLIVGRSVNDSKGIGAGGTTGTLTFDTGTINVNTATLGYQMQDFGAKTVGTLNVNGTAVLTVNTSMQLGRFLGADPTNGISSAILNVNGGLVTVNGSITTTTSILNSFNDSEVNVNSGSLYVKGNVGPLYQLTLGSGSTNTLDLGNSPNPIAPVCLASNLSTASPVYINILGTALDLGTIHLIQYGAYTAGSVDDIVATIPGNVFGYLTNDTALQNIDLVITNTATFSWNGITNGVNISSWDIGVTKNWKSNNIAVTFATNNNALFDDSVVGTTTVSLTTNIPPAAIIFKNSSKSYTLSGAGSLSGTAGLTKNGTNTVTLANTGTNTFTGAVAINAGKILLGGADDRLPTNAAVVLSGGTLDLNGQNQSIASLAGTSGEVKLGGKVLTLHPSTTTGFAGLISGTGGSLMVSNLAGSQILGGANTYDGGTVITNAALIITNTTGSALGSGPITIKGTSPNPGSGTLGLWIGNGAGTIGSVSTAIITNTSVVAFKNGLDLTFTNTVVGAAGLYFNPVNSARVTINGNSTFTGRVQIDGGKVQMASSTCFGPSASATAIVLGNAAQLELNNNVTIARPVSQAGPSGTVPTTVGIVNFGGTNVMTGLITGISGGSQWDYRSDAGKITFRGNWTNTAVSGARVIWFRGAGEGEWAGGIGSTPGLISTLYCTNNLLKDGTGTWTLSGTNYYNGFTGISNGTFVINGVQLNSSLMTTGATSDTNVYVANGATLRGLGKIGTPPLVDIQSGATLAPGTAATLGQLTVSNNLTLRTGSFTQLRVANTGVVTNDGVRVGKTLNIDGTLTVTLGSGRLVGGEVFQLFSAATTTGFFAATNLPALESPLTWDTSQLGAGKLIVSGTVASKAFSLTQFGVKTNGFQLNMSSDLTNWSYRVLATTNLTNLLSTWTVVGSGSIAGGAFSFTDTGTTNFTQRFYRVVTP